MWRDSAGAAVSVGLRNAPAAVVVVFCANTIRVWIAGHLGDWFAGTIQRRLPRAAVESIAGVSSPGSGGYTWTCYRPCRAYVAGRCPGGGVLLVLPARRVNRPGQRFASASMPASRTVTPNS